MLCSGSYGELGGCRVWDRSYGAMELGASARNRDLVEELGQG